MRRADHNPCGTITTSLIIRPARAPLSWKVGTDRTTRSDAGTMREVPIQTGPGIFSTSSRILP